MGIRDFLRAGNGRAAASRSVSHVTHPIAVAVRPVIESLEDRRLLSSIAGAPAATAGTSYSLHLDNAGLISPSWVVDWGDGDTSAPTGPTASHTYFTPGNYAPVATATTTSGSVSTPHAQGFGLDPTFASNGVRFDTSDVPGVGNGAVLQTVGTEKRLLVAGFSRAGNGAYTFAVTRYALDGTPDTSFGIDGIARATFTYGWGQGAAVAIDSAGRIVVVGGNQTHPAFDVARFTPGGLLDTTFGDVDPTDSSKRTGTTETPLLDWNSATSLVIDTADDSYYVGGTKLIDSNTARFAVARYTAAGVLDTTWGDADATAPGGHTGGVVTAFQGNFEFSTSVALTPAGKLLVGGFEFGPSGWNFALAQFTTTGALDTSFGAGGKVTTDFEFFHDGVNALAIQPDGRIVAVGQESFWYNDDDGNRYNFAVARYNADGSLDPTFGGVNQNPGQLTLTIGDGDAIANAVTLQPDGRIVLGGYSFDGGRRVFTLARLNAADGSLDGTFGINGVLTTGIGSAEASVSALVQLPPTSGGGVIAVGTGTTSGTFGNGFDNRRIALARYLPDNTVAVASTTSGLTAPTSLTASAGTLVHLAWTAPAGAPSGVTYDVYRSTTSGFSTNNLTPIATGITTTVYNDASADNGTTYYYRVVAVTIASRSPASNLAFYTTTGTAHDHIRNGSFESPRVGRHNDRWGPFTAGPWTFTANAGIVDNDNYFTTPPPDGTQAAGLYHDGGEIAQTLQFAGGDYALSFQARQQTGSHQDLTVIVDNQQVLNADGTPWTLTPSTTAYTPFVTPRFTVSAGTHTIKIKGLNTAGGDNMAFVDVAQLVRPPVITGTYPLNATTGEPVGTEATSGVVASFKGSVPDGDLTHYTADIQWDDSTGVDHANVWQNYDGSFTVESGHTFTTAGVYTGVLTVTHTPSGMSAAANLYATVTDPTPPPPPTPPERVTGLTATFIPPAGSQDLNAVGLVWDHIDTADAYLVTRTNEDTGTTTTFSPIEDPTANSFVDNVGSGVDGHTHYSYTVTAQNDAGEADASEPADITTPNGVPDMLGDYNPDGPVSATSGGDPVQIPVHDLLANARDPDSNDTLSIDEASLGASLHGGTVTLTTAVDDPGSLVLEYTAPAGYIGSDSFTYAVTDGTDSSLPATVNIDVMPDSTGGEDDPTVYVRQGGSVEITIPQGASIYGGRLHAASFTALGNYVYLYTPVATYVGRDYVDYITEYNPKHRINIVVGDSPVRLIPFRTGLRTDHQVLQATKLQHHAADYVILTNNNFDEQHEDGSPDFADDTSHFPDSTLSMVTDDADLAHFKLAGVSSASGTSQRPTKISIELSDPSSVRLLGGDGTVIPDADLTWTIGSDEAQEGYFASGYTDFWVEGLTPNPDLKISITYMDEDDKVISEDKVHLDVANWDVVRKDGQLNAPVTITGIGGLQDVIYSHSNDVYGNTYQYKNSFTGLTGLGDATVVTENTTNLADRLVETGAQITDDWKMLYTSSSSNNILTPSEQDDLHTYAGARAIDPQPGITTPVRTYILTKFDTLVHARDTEVSAPLWSDSIGVGPTPAQTFEELWRAGLGSYINPQTGEPDQALAIYKLIDTQVNGHMFLCSEAALFPLLSFASIYNLPISSTAVTNFKVTRKNGETYIKQLFRDFREMQNRLGAGYSVDAYAKMMAEQIIAVTRNSVFDPNAILNYSYDPSASPKVANHDPSNITDESWTVSPLPTSAVVDPPQSKLMQLLPTAPGYTIAGNYLNVGNLQPGDVISTVLMDGWPGGDIKTGKSAGHTDIITSISKIGGAVTLDSRVTLLEMSSFDPSPGFFTTKIKDLLNWSTALGNQTTRIAHQYVMRSFDFANFDRLFQP